MAWQEADLSSGSTEVINFSSMGSKMSLKWGLVIFWAADSAISQILMFVLQELVTDRFLNLVSAKLLLN